MNQIQNLETEPHKLTNIRPEDEEAVLNTDWLKPLKIYNRGESFGERSLYNEKEYRAGTAVCNTDVIVMTLIKADY